MIGLTDYIRLKNLVLVRVNILQSYLKNKKTPVEKMNQQELLQWVESNCSDEKLKSSIETFIRNSPFESLVELAKEDWKEDFGRWGVFIYNKLHPSKNQEFGC